MKKIVGTQNRKKFCPHPHTPTHTLTHTLTHIDIFPRGFCALPPNNSPEEKTICFILSPKIKEDHPLSCISQYIIYLERGSFIDNRIDRNSLGKKQTQLSRFKEKPKNGKWELFDQAIVHFLPFSCIMHIFTPKISFFTHHLDTNAITQHEIVTHNHTIFHA